MVGKKFWETEPAHSWDTINGVGLRGHYLCTVLAARMMVPRRSGLIVTVSSIGGLKWVEGRWSGSPPLAALCCRDWAQKVMSDHMFNVCYGVGKVACDRMAADCAFELRQCGVTMISLWPGPVNTESIAGHI